MTTQNSRESIDRLKSKTGLENLMCVSSRIPVTLKELEQEIAVQHLRLPQEGEEGEVDDTLDWDVAQNINA